MRIGRFHGALFESAPVQLVPASNPSSAEIASGAMVDMGAGSFARRQQVVYTGVFLNEIPRLDIAQSTFTADFYLWIRFARGAGAGAADPTDVDFPDLVRGSFDAKRPAEEGDLDDGTSYRLWRVRGDFKNDFDLHHYPLDRQTLALRLFNARAASDRLVYVQDRRSLAGFGTQGLGAGQTSAAAAPGAATSAPSGSYVAPAAFRNLTQWDATGTTQRRDILVTESALGNPRLVGAQGNESRLTSSWAQYLQQVLWVPAGALAAALDGLLVGDLAHQMEGEVAGHCHVFGAMTDAQA